MIQKIKLILIRGLPSSGKTTLSSLFTFPTLEADLFFHENNDPKKEYKFDVNKIYDAHQWCQSETIKTIESLRSLRDKNLTAMPLGVIVSNTFTQRWEMQPYLDMVEDDVELMVIDLFDGGKTDEELFDRNLHGVPLHTFENMREIYEHDWRNGNPTPPWERETNQSMPLNS